MKNKLVITVLFSLLYSNFSLANTYEADFGDRGICDEKNCAPFITPAFLKCNISNRHIVFYTTDKMDTCKTHVYVEKYKIENLRSKYCEIATNLSKKNIITSNFLLSSMGCK